MKAQHSARKTQVALATPATLPDSDLGKRSSDPCLWCKLCDEDCDWCPERDAFAQESAENPQVAS